MPKCHLCTYTTKKESFFNFKSENVYFSRKTVTDWRRGMSLLGNIYRYIASLKIKGRSSIAERELHGITMMGGIGT